MPRALCSVLLALVASRAMPQPQSRGNPLCDAANGGSCVAFPQTLAKGIAAIKNVDAVIPGHSPITALKDLQEYQRYNADLVAEARDAMNAGKSVDDAAASIHLENRYPGYQSTRVKAAVQVIYDELNHK